MARLAHWKALLLAGLIGTAACTAEKDPDLLRLGEKKVLRSEFFAHLATLESQGIDTSSVEVRRSLLQAFLEQRVLMLEAQSRGFNPNTSSEEDQRLAVRRFLTDALTGTDPKPVEIQRYFDEHQAELRKPATVTLRQILVPSENEARDVRRRLVKDPKEFDLLARARSRSPEASQGGHLGTFARGELPVELDQAAFSIPLKAPEIVATSYGYHVLIVDARTDGQEAVLADCGERIRALLKQRKTEEATRQLIADLLARAKVNHEIIKAAVDTRR
ncbi:MAG: peptidylprolyl isomerase [Vicinamibacteria bacterium]|jgi:parvulin-like peptidyl-prolyl isomerase|nr:peptidylprolyl isomerase [Vicinamibacteria bacterium]